MCKSGKSLLRWLTFKRAHQSPGHLTHLSFSHWAAGINFDWLRISVYQVLSPYDDINDLLSNPWPVAPVWTLDSGEMCYDVLSEFSCCPVMCRLWLDPGCLSVSAGCVKLLQEEGNSVVTPSSELHTWLALELPPIMILTGHNLPPIEKLSENVLQLKLTEV